LTAPHRILRILECFSVERPVIAPEWLMQQLGASRASIYRDLRQLSQSGLLERLDDRGYALGPRIVQMDRQIRLGDPLLKAAGELPEALATESQGRVLLCRLHINTVLCILQTAHPEGALKVSYERGRAMPLYRGATSRIILAHLNVQRLRELTKNDGQAIQAAGLPHTPQELHEHLQPIRKQGHVISKGEVDPDAIGIAVPLLFGKRLLGSLSVVLPVPLGNPPTEAKALALLKSTARRIEARMESMGRPASE
jgi:DNA-binding IclR family transcriptional regulator